MHYRLTAPYLLASFAFAISAPTASAQAPRPLEPIAAKLQPTRTVVYKTVGTRRLNLHIFEPTGHQPGDRRPVYMAIHGGGWTGGNARKFYPLADHFAKLGMLGISLEYRLMKPQTGTTVLDCVKDARSAVRYLRRHARALGIDPKRIAVAGGSAGGHLAAGTALFDRCPTIDHVTANERTADGALISCQPNLLILYYPVIDTSANGYGQQKIGKLWQELSPVDQVTAKRPPTIIFHGTADTVTPFSGATLFQKRMTQAGNTCQLISHKDGEHGYLIFDLKLFQQAMDRTHAFLQTHHITRPSATPTSPANSNGTTPATVPRPAE